MPIYSGGLGVLAGDHLKAASDLGMPLVGVGLMYREGYFRQYLNVDGWQQERYPENDFFNLPLIPEIASDGTPLLVSVPFPGREVSARVWRIQVGRVPLYLLDTNIPQNNPDDRSITARLYGGDHDMRIRQEMILGIGGIRALRALGKTPTVCHMNEGHSAFCGLERIRALMEEHTLDFATAREAVRPGTCFTTHTPVPAGNDIFPPAADRALLLRTTCRSSRSTATSSSAWAGRTRATTDEPFCMTVLAIRLANITNGVSKLHGSVSRKMWKNIWPDLPDAEIPITLDHQRRPHAELAVAGDGPALRPLPGHPVGGTADRPQHLEARRPHPRRRAVADARAPPRAAGGLRPAPPQGAAQAPRRARRPRSPAPTRCSTPRR